MAEDIVEGLRLPEQEQVNTTDLINHYSDWISTVEGRTDLTPEKQRIVIARGMAALFRIGERMKGKAYTDALTKVGNRRAFDEKFDLLTKGNEKFGFLFLDIDHFKILNDKLSHNAGDSALAQIALVIATSIKQTREQEEENDIIARYGGEEFVALLRGVSEPQQLRSIGERIRQNLESSPLHLTYLNEKTKKIEQAVRPVTLSVGGGVFTPGTDPTAFLEIVDGALYGAKKTRNSTVVIGAENG